MLLIYNAKVKGYEKLQGILVSGEVIKEIANSDEMIKKHNKCKKYDAKGNRVIPGLNDSHLHLIGYSRLKRNLRLENAKSIADVISLGKRYLKENENLKVIIGNLYNDNNFEEKRLLLKEDLDKISKDIPIICYRVCGHICTINTKAIQILNLDPEIKVNGGSIDVLNNELTGVLRENAMDLLNPLINLNYTIEEYETLILDGITDANKVGLTSLQPNDINTNIDEAKKIYTAYQNLANKNKLNARINHQITFEQTDLIKEFLEFASFKNDYLKVGPLKLFIDGSLGAKTAAVFDNYLNDNQNGILCLSEENLLSLTKFMNNLNKPVIVHAIGDRGITITLDVFKNVSKENINRNGIVHVQITSKEILNRFKEQNVCALVQPIFINTDMFMVYNLINKELANTSYAFNTLFQNTITSFGSDAPVEDFNPFYGMYNAITRKDFSMQQIYLEEEKMSIDDVITAYTSHGAYMSHEEDLKGKIVVGQFGDLIVLNQDIYEIESKLIKDTEVVCTIVGGRIVYEK